MISRKFTIRNSNEPIHAFANGFNDDEDTCLQIVEGDPGSALKPNQTRVLVIGAE